jgi:hypothetical protein
MVWNNDVDEAKQLPIWRGTTQVEGNYILDRGGTTSYTKVNNSLDGWEQHPKLRGTNNN